LEMASQTLRDQLKMSPESGDASRDPQIIGLRGFDNPPVNVPRTGGARGSEIVQ
jgi:hypothetical protein